jgi:hypothetical protein
LSISSALEISEVVAAHAEVGPFVAHKLGDELRQNQIHSLMFYFRDIDRTRRNGQSSEHIVSANSACCGCTDLEIADIQRPPALAEAGARLAGAASWILNEFPTGQAWVS